MNEITATRLVNHQPPHWKYYRSSVSEETDGTYTHTIEYGRDVPGVVPTVTSKPHADMAAAMAAHSATVSAKRGRGYSEGATLGPSQTTRDPFEPYAGGA